MTQRENIVNDNLENENEKKKTQTQIVVEKQRLGSGASLANQSKII